MSELNYKKAKLPEWCKLQGEYQHGRDHPIFSCWSLMSGYIKNKKDCKECDMLDNMEAK
jgi:hypothetical protein